MTKYEDEHETIKLLLAEIKKRNPSSKWTDKNTLTFLEGKKEIGTVILTDKKYEVTGDIDKQIKELKKIVEDSKKSPLKADDLKDTPFEGLIGKKSDFEGLFDNKNLLDVYVKKLKTFNIGKIIMKDNLNQPATISNKLTLGIEIIPYDDVATNLESGYQGRLRTFLKTTYEVDARTASDIRLNSDSAKFFMALSKEKIIDIKIEEQLIGKYYPERNFIQLFFNPFNLKNIGVFDDSPHMAFNNILAALKELEIKVNDVSGLKEKLFVSEFMKNSRVKLKNLDKNIEDNRKAINDTEENLRKYIEEMSSKMAEASYIRTSIDNSGRGLFKEIEEAKTLPFITSIDIEAGSIIYKFKPTTIPIPNFKRIDYDTGRGKRHLWIGAITFTINSTEFKITSEVPFFGHGHPHCSGHPRGNPCFGSGEGRNKIYEALAGNRFKELAKLLWFWIKTYRNEEAYVKVWDGYDDTLKHGYPVFDEKGNRIEINDPKLIKSGEQLELTKADDYADNIKKFADITLET